MRIPRIYQQGDLSPGLTIELDRMASHHLSRVLRLRNDDPVIIFNGQGGEYLGSLHIEGKQAAVNIREFNDTSRESNLDITLLQGISKGERMDISIQKAVELGVRKIVPVVCQRTVVNLKDERKDKKQQHWQGIIINACEQSGRNFIPQLAPAVKLHELLGSTIEGLKLTLDPEASTRLHDIKPPGNQITLLIGPEGGLTIEEIAQASASGFSGIQLGSRILRTETAALVALSVLQAKWGDLA